MDWSVSQANSYILVFAIFLASQSLAMRNTSLTAKQQAKVNLKSDLYSHPVVRYKLSPHGDDGVVNITSFRYAAIEILFLDEASQTLMTSSHIEVTWTDDSLGWDPDDYNGITNVFMDMDMIWYPRFEVANTADEEYRYLNVPETIRLSNTGEFMYEVAIITKTKCKLDMKLYPFDNQTCTIGFYPSWNDVPASIHRLSSIDPKEITVLADEFKGEWNLIPETLQLGYQSNDTRPAILAKLHMSRSRMYYILVLLAPMYMTSMMTSLVFWIPPGCGDKLAFLTTMYLSNSMALATVAGTTPRSMINIPELMFFIFIIMLDNFLAMVGSIFVIRRYDAEQDFYRKLDSERQRRLMKTATKKMVSVSQLHVKKETEMTITTDIDNNNDNYNDNAINADIAEPSKRSELLANFRRRLSRGWNRIWSYRKRKKAKRSNIEDDDEDLDKVPCSFCISSNTWDKIFFVVFHMISLPVYYYIFVPGKSLNQLNLGLYQE